MILTSRNNGRLNECTAHRDLARIFGADNLFEQDGLDGMSGDMVYVTIVYPKDPTRSLDISWQDDTKKVPASWTIRGNKSRWKSVNDTALGASLKNWNDLNGRSFLLAGFGWDYEGTITSWENGILAAELDGGHGRVIIRLRSPP